MTVRVLAFEPSARPPEWDPAARDQLFQGLPDGTVVTNRDGELAAKLGATTSGHISLFQPNGELIFEAETSIQSMQTSAQRLTSVVDNALEANSRLLAQSTQLQHDVEALVD